MKLEIDPQEVYLFEQITKIEFFENMRHYHRLFLDALEELLQMYMHNLPYDLRSKPLPYQVDATWGEIVLPNLRDTMSGIDEFYRKLKNGDMSYIAAGAGAIGSDRKGIREFWDGWMDDLSS